MNFKRSDVMNQPIRPGAIKRRKDMQSRMKSFDCLGDAKRRQAEEFKRILEESTTQMERDRKEEEARGLKPEWTGWSTGLTCPDDQQRKKAMKKAQKEQVPPRRS